MKSAAFLILLLVATGTSLAAVEKDVAPDRILDTGYRLSNVFAWRPDGKQIACASETGEIGIWEWPGLALVKKLQGREGAAGTLSWHPDNRRLAHAGEHSEVSIWDVPAARVETKVLAPGGFAIWSPDGKRLATSYSGGTALFDESLTKPVRVLVDTGGKGQFQWRPDSREAITQKASSPSPPWQINVRVWNVDSGVPSRLLSIEGVGIYRTAWHPDCRRLAAACRDGSLRILDSTTGKTLRTLEPPPSIPLALSWSPDGETLVGRPRGQLLYLWNLKTGKIDRSIAIGEWGSTPTWSPDGKWLASGSVEGLRFWRFKNTSL